MTCTHTPPLKAMILAAGKGTRMRPLTDHCPKPLLKVKDKPLLEWHLQRLKNAGIQEIVINCAYLGDQIENYIAHRKDDGLVIQVINEGDEPLETAGGIANALSLLGEDPFLVVNGDVWIDLDFDELALRLSVSNPEPELILVNNPSHNTGGDFAISVDGFLKNKSIHGEACYTFSGLSILTSDLFADLDATAGALGPHLREWADQLKLKASVYSGYWLDVGTPERLAALEEHLAVL